MTALILESLGTWELLLIAIVALVVFGPRKIPEMARKAGKLMAELRSVSDDFKSTWEREAALDEDEKKAFDFSDEAIAREPDPPMIEEVAGPEIYEEFNKDLEEAESEETKEEDSISDRQIAHDESNDKENWL